MGSRTWARIGVALLVAAAAFLVYWYDLHHYLTLERVKQYKERIDEVYAAHPFLTIAVYFCVYVVATALSIPGAVVMTLAGAAIFGLWLGTLVISFASTIGASLAFVVARFLLRDWVNDHFGAKLELIYEGVRREGAFYLFTLRLVPIFPFFLINILMALTPIRLRTFYWVSQLGMLPGTIAYVNAGTQLSRISSPSDILSPRVLLSFALLGILPLASKRAIAIYRKRRRREGSQS